MKFYVTHFQKKKINDISTTNFISLHHIYGEPAYIKLGNLNIGKFSHIKSTKYANEYNINPSIYNQNLVSLYLRDKYVVISTNCKDVITLIIYKNKYYGPMHSIDVNNWDYILSL
jgi:hypothetical protein